MVGAFMQAEHSCDQALKTRYQRRVPMLSTRLILQALSLKSIVPGVHDVQHYRLRLSPFNRSCFGQWPHLRVRGQRTAYVISERSMFLFVDLSENRPLYAVADFRN